MTTLGVEINGSVTPIGEEGEVPSGWEFPLALSAQAGKLQILTLDPTTGNAVAADDNTPHQIAAGMVYPDEVTTTDATNAGNAIARTTWRGFTHSAPSTIANDGFAASDVGVPWWIADTETPGKLSHTSTKNRSLGGLVFGLVRKGSTAIRAWGGPLAQAIARGVLVADNHTGGVVAYPADATAATDIGSTSATTSALVIPRSKTHGLITSIEIIPSATQTITSGNDRTITIWKVDTLGVNADVKVATFASTTAMAAPNAANCLTAHVASAFTLIAGTLALLETDILVYSTVHAGSGVAFPQSAIRVNMKVI